MKTIKQIEIASKTGISQSVLSEVFNGKKAVSKIFAQKAGAFTGRRWVEYLDMEPKAIRSDFEAAIQGAPLPECSCQCQGQAA